MSYYNCVKVLMGKWTNNSGTLRISHTYLLQPTLQKEISQPAQMGNKSVPPIGAKRATGATGANGARTGANGRERRRRYERARPARGKQRAQTSADDTRVRPMRKRAYFEIVCRSPRALLRPEYSSGASRDPSFISDLNFRIFLQSFLDRLRQSKRRS